jgi:hypothetical protein
MSEMSISTALRQNGSRYRTSMFLAAMPRLNVMAVADMCGVASALIVACPAAA